MDGIKHSDIFISLLLIHICALQNISGAETYLSKEEKIDLRRDLDKITLELLLKRDPLYYSYVFNSGIGNREELVMKSMKKEAEFASGESIVSWQSLESAGLVYLLGRSNNSVSLIVSSSVFVSNRSSHFSEHFIELEAEVVDTAIFSRWNHTSSKPEVLVAVAINNPMADIIWYKVTDNKLALMTRWPHYKKINSVVVANFGGLLGTYQLITVDSDSPAIVDVFNIVFDRVRLDFRLVQSFHLTSECSSVTVCRVGDQMYTVFLLKNDESLSVYRTDAADPNNYQNHTNLSFPRVSQVAQFSVALQTYLAVNGENAHVLKLTERGDFIIEEMLGEVDEWLALPVSTYRSEVVLFSRNKKVIKAYVWAGTLKGFKTILIPDCESCLEGVWSGAVSVPFRQQNCILLPQPRGPSKLVNLAIDLQDNDPLLEKIRNTRATMTDIENKLNRVTERMKHADARLKNTVKKEHKNVIDAKWTVGKIVTPELKLDSVVRPESEVDNSSTKSTQVEMGDIHRIQSMVEEIERKFNNLSASVQQKEDEVWGLEGFAGKVTFKNRLIVDNLTISHLNNHPVNHLLNTTFRRNKPEKIQQIVIIENLKVDDVVVDKINNFTTDSLHFSDQTVVLKNDVTFMEPLRVDGDLILTKGKINGMNISQVLCHGQQPCSVFPILNIDMRGGDTTDDVPISPSEINWKQVIAGKNLTVLKVNGVDWDTLTKNVVYKDRYQNISGTTFINGTLTAESVLLARQVEKGSKSKRREGMKSASVVEDPLVSKTPGSADRKEVLENLKLLHPGATLVVSSLEVEGKVICDESEWGASASDVVFSDVSKVRVQGIKQFDNSVKVSNGLEVKGTVAGINVSHFLTNNTDQVFHGPTILNGNVTLDKVTLTGLWNGVNISQVHSSEDPTTSVTGSDSDHIIVDRIRVLETLNGIPVSDLLFTDAEGNVSVDHLSAQSLSVTGDIIVDGKVCGHNLEEFEKRKFSKQNEQNITGNVVISQVVTDELETRFINNVDVPSFIRRFEHSNLPEIIHLSELEVDGDITTDFGMNGYNLTEIAAEAIRLTDNNEIEECLTFKDEVELDIVECQGFMNDVSCEYWLRQFDDAVYRTNNTVTLTGKKKFTNILQITEDFDVEEINGYKTNDILTKTTEQEIPGNLLIFGDLEVSNELMVFGLLNNENITEFGHRCSLTDNTIVCSGDVVFKESVNVNEFNSEKINGVVVDEFLESIINIEEPQYVKGFKNFTGVVTVENLNVVNINEENWNDFLLDAIDINGIENINYPVIFEEKVLANQVFVSFNVTADSINGVDLNQWQEDSIPISEAGLLISHLHLSSASSRGNITVVEFNGIPLREGAVCLHEPVILDDLRAVSITAEQADIAAVNGQALAPLERNTLKISGNQTVKSDLVIDDLLITGNLATETLVDGKDLRDAISLESDQLLDGEYKFECIIAEGNVSATGLVSGINMTEWNQTGVTSDGDQELSGEWTVLGPVEFRGPVRGEGKLGGIDLNQLEDSIRTNILDVHNNMMDNLTEECTKTNEKLSLARSQPADILYVDIAQEFEAADHTLVTHFKNGEDDYLVITERNCITTFFKWDQHTGMFFPVSSGMSSFGVNQLVVLHSNQLTYLVTSSPVTSNCPIPGEHLWLFKEDNAEHVLLLELQSNDIEQGLDNSLYSMNSSGVFKWELEETAADGRTNLGNTHKWEINTEGKRLVPMSAGVGLALQDDSVIISLEPQLAWLPNVYRRNNCSGDVTGMAVDPSQQFVAVATSETAEVPRYSDHVKIFRTNGRLFDILRAERASHVQWLPVPGQTWLLFLQNHTSLQFYQLKGDQEGFQLKVSADMSANSISSLALLVDVKVNPQPFLILETNSSIRILRVYLQGDPYLGSDLDCDFDQDLLRVPEM